MAADAVGMIFQMMGNSAVKPEIQKMKKRGIPAFFYASLSALFASLRSFQSSRRFPPSQ
jgi:hypothetical protein